MTFQHRDALVDQIVHHLLFGTRLVTIINAIRQDRSAPATAPK